MNAAVLDAPPKRAEPDAPPVRRPVETPSVVAPEAAGRDRCVAADYRFPPTGRVATTVALHTRKGSFEVPGMSVAYDQFHPWWLSDDCPEKVRFSFLGDVLELDLMPESVNSHGAPKTEAAIVVCGRVKRARLGYCGIDSTAYSCRSVGLSCEPDFVVVTYDALNEGRATLTPKANRPDDYIEISGAADLVGELISDSSVAKDRRLEPPLLFAAGVREYWRIDCRGQTPEFELFRRGESDWEPTPADAEGFRRSDVLGRRYRLTRLPPIGPIAQYDMEERD